MKTPEQTIIDAAVAHANEEIPRESCGLVVGGRYIKCRNIAEHIKDFEIHPDDSADAEDAGEIEWVVHSHVTTGARPSLADRDRCEASKRPWLIVTPAGKFRTLEPCGFVADIYNRDYSYGVHNCATLVRDWFARERGLTFDFESGRDRWWMDVSRNDMLEGLQRLGFVRVPLDALQAGDVLAMALESPVPHHLAVWLGNGQILHHLRGRKSAAEFYHQHWRDRTCSAWRYEA